MQTLTGIPHLPITAGSVLAIPNRGTRHHWEMEGVGMKVKFVLTMDDVVVGDKRFDQVIMDWTSEVDQREIMEVSHRWITTQNFLTQRMVGLSRVGESSLTIEPLEQADDE